MMAHKVQIDNKVKVLELENFQEV